MQQYKDNFVEESLELLSSVEKALLLMEVTPNDPDLIQEVFRALHTIKGNSSMFGFSTIADFTHYLESVYEHIRSGRQEINKNIVSATLAAVDHIFTLIKNVDDPNIAKSETHIALNSRLALLLKEMGGDSTAHDEASVNQQVQQDGKKTYEIHFAPHKEVFFNGTNPLSLLAELQGLGKCEIIANESQLPLLDELEPVYCYMSWNITLETDVAPAAIEEIFQFLKGRCVLDIKIKESKAVGELLAPTLPELFAGVNASAARTNMISSIRVPAEKLDGLMGLVSELITLQAKLGTIAEFSLHPELQGVSENFEKILTRLRDNAFSLCVVPVKTMLTPFNRLVRDLSAELDKEIEFVTEGIETELDKNIIEGLSDPIMHLLRNSIDHGIETEAARLAAGKRKQGRISFKAYCAGPNVYVEIEDDGRGIDTEKIRHKAIEKGLINKDEVLSEAEIFNLIFLPGISTAEKVSNISGRGVGMDVVKRKIEDIRGQIKIKSTVNVGTTTIIKLPITISIIDGLLVQINKGAYVIPLSSVERCLEAPLDKQINHFNKLLILEGQQIPYINLCEEFGSGASAERSQEIVLVYFEERRVALLVERVIGKLQAVLKPLGKHYQKVDNISGATILGDGSIALVLDTNKITEHYLHRRRFAHVN